MTEQEYSDLFEKIRKQLPMPVLLFRLGMITRLEAEALLRGEAIHCPFCVCKNSTNHGSESEDGHNKNEDVK